MKAKYSLLTWEDKKAEAGEYRNKIVLVKYFYSDTGYIRKELFETPANFPNYSTSEAKVYDNRFVINRRGDIFDLHKNKIIYDHIGFDYFLYKSGDSVVFSHTDYKPEPPFHNDTARHNAIKTAFYFFNLRTGKIVPLKALEGLRFPYDGILSPNKQMLAYLALPDTLIMNLDFMKDSSFYLCGWTRTTLYSGDIFVKSVNNDSTRILQGAEIFISLRSAGSEPVEWLNDHELVVQKKPGHLARIDVLSKTSTDFPVLPNADPCVFPPRLEKDSNNHIIYYCSTPTGEIFTINTGANLIEPVSLIAISQHYSLGPARGFHPNDFEYVKGYYYKNDKITDDSTTTYHHSITPDELIAIQCKERIPSRNQYDNWNTIRIFDPSEKKSTTITVEYLRSLIGWVKEE